MADQIYKVRDPQGNIREIKGPAGAADDEIIAQAQKLFAAPIPATPSGVPTGRRGVDQIPGYGGPVPAAPQAAPQGYGGPLPEALMAPIETAVALGTSAVTAPIVELAKIGGTLTSGKFGTQAGIRAGEATGRKVQQFFQPTLSPTAQAQVESIGNALASTGLQGVPLNVMNNMATLARPAVQQVAPAIKAPIEARQQRVQAERVRQSELNAPRIDAVKDALDLGLALDPALSNPNAVTRIKSGAVGSTGLQGNLSKLNLPKIAARAREDMGLPETIKLDAKAFDTALEAPAISVPYNKVSTIPRINADDAVIRDINSLKVTPAIGDTGQAAAVNSFIDTVQGQLQGGAPGSTVLDGIRQLRRDAQAVYNQQSVGINPPSPGAIAIADVNMGIARALETAIENSITDPMLVADFRNARALAGRINDYRRATNLATGVVNPQELAKLAAEGRPLSGNIAKIANVAANFPENMQGGVVREPTFREKATRSGAAGTAGAILGSPLGLPGAIIGGGVGAATGNIASALMARRMATPEYQRSNAMPPDYRPVPMGEPPPSGPTIPQNRMLTPYQQKVFGPSGGRPAPPLRVVSYDENGNPIYQPNVEDLYAARGQNFTEPPQPEFGNMPTTFVAQRGLPNEIPRQTYEAQKRAELAQELRARAERKPTKGGIELIIDTAGNLVEAPAAAAPKTLAPSALESAVQKMAGQMAFETRSQYRTTQTGSNMDRSPVYQTESVPLDPSILTRPDELRRYALPTRESQAFAMTAEEKIAWNKAKADLAEVVPGMKALSNEAVAARIADRDWTANAVASARAKVEALARQDALLTEQLANRDNLRLLARDIESKQRQLAKVKEDSVRIRDLADMLDETMRAARPDTSRRQQGPKTRAAKRNALAPDNQNNLAP
jgi:hypothetical protein